MIAVDSKGVRVTGPLLLFGREIGWGVTLLAPRYRKTGIGRQRGRIPVVWYQVAVFTRRTRMGRGIALVTACILSVP